MPRVAGAAEDIVRLGIGGVVQLGAAVVGAGYWGPNLIRNFNSSLSWRLYWVCDADEERAQRAARGYADAAPTSSFEEILDDSRVHAVALATPAATHADLAERALRAGKHLLVEKPLANSSAAARRVIGLADELGLVVMADHTFCYTSAVQKIAELVRAGELGAVRYVDSVRINLGLVQPDIDVFWDLAPHDLSILDVVLPEGSRPEAVAAVGADPIGAGKACVGYLTLRLGGGAIAHVHVNWLSPMKMRTMVFGGSRRMAVWDDVNPAQRLSIYDRGVELQPTDDVELRRRSLVSYRSGDMTAPALAEVEALSRVVEELAASIAERRPPLTDARAGLRVLQVLEAAATSLEGDGGFVEIG